jgi:hypothetical protein
MPLLEVESCRILALRALTLVTHHGGETTRREIALQAPVLVRLIQRHPSDAMVAELAIITLSHSIGAYTNVEQAPDVKALKLLDMPNTLKVVTERLRDPAASLFLLEHALHLVAWSTFHCSSAYHSNPSTVNFLVAGLRSPDIAVRCTCLASIIRLHMSSAEQDHVQLDPHKLIASLRGGFPQHLSSILWDYGHTRCETTVILKTAADYQRAMMKSGQDHDLCALGITLAELITRTEFSIADGMFEVEDSRTGERSIDTLGLPFTRWRDALPICAKRIRVKVGVTDADLDQADILDLKYLIMSARLPDAAIQAKNAIKRNPAVAYFYYVITLNSDNAEGLRAAKKGMKCPSTTLTPFLRFQLLQRAVDHASTLGLRTLQDADTTQQWEEGIAFLSSSLEDARTYVEQAPPDNRNMKNVIYWYIVLTLAMKGPSVSETLNDKELTVRAHLQHILLCNDSTLRRLRSRSSNNRTSSLGCWLVLHPRPSCGSPNSSCSANMSRLRRNGVPSSRDATICERLKEEARNM